MRNDAETRVKYRFMLDEIANLEKIEIPDNLIIPARGFEGWTSLETVIIGDNLNRGPEKYDIITVYVWSNRLYADISAYDYETFLHSYYGGCGIAVCCATPLGTGLRRCQLQQRDFDMERRPQPIVHGA